jgi:uncharacterized peroxidase-related enzyme
MSFLQSLPAEATVPDIFSMKRRAAGHLIDFHTEIMRAESPLSVAEREMIAAFVSGVNACAYCHGIHKATAEAFGIAEGVFAELLDDIDSADIEPRMKPILRYARKLTETPARMTQGDADQVLVAGWSEQALHDAIQVICLFNFMNRLLEGHGIKGSDELFAARGPMLKEHGYAPLKQAIGLDT